MLRSASGDPSLRGKAPEPARQSHALDPISPEHRAGNGHAESAGELERLANGHEGLSAALSFNSPQSSHSNISSAVATPPAGTATATSACAVAEFSLPIARIV